MIDLKQAIRNPGHLTPYQIKQAYEKLEEYLVAFREMEEVIGKNCVSEGILEHHIRNLRETFFISWKKQI